MSMPSWSGLDSNSGPLPALSVDFDIVFYRCHLWWKMLTVDWMFSEVYFLYIRKGVKCAYNQVGEDQASFPYPLNAKLPSALFFSHVSAVQTLPPTSPPLPKEKKSPTVSCDTADELLVLHRSTLLSWNPFPHSYSLPLVNTNLQGTRCINCNLLECSY